MYIYWHPTERTITAIVSDDYAHSYGFFQMQKTEGLMMKVERADGVFEVWAVIAIFQPLTDYYQEPLF